MNVKNLFRFLAIIASCPATVVAGPFAPAAGQIGTTAIAHNDPGIIAWAVGASVDYSGASALPDLEFRDASLAIGAAKSGDAAVFDAVSLGRGGEITLDFATPITNGAGADFAVFENSFSDTFLELGNVWVSDGSLDPDGSGEAVFLPFFLNTRSLTSSPVNAFGTLDPTNIDGLAGKYRGGFGTPFDLDSLIPLINIIKSENPSFTFNLNSIQQVKIVDIVGDGSVTDAAGQPIYDPYPTVGSTGFDLDAVGVIHQIGGPPDPEPEPEIEMIPVPVPPFFVFAQAVLFFLICEINIKIKRGR